VDIGKTTSVSLDTDFQNNRAAPVTVTLSFVLSFSDDDGNYQEIKTEMNVTLLNKTKFDAAEVLALVTTGYKGDYTLAWTQTNDYEDGVKTAWVNAKGYASTTDYLVWVNIAYQRVNVFTGSAGKWVLDRSFIVGTGASGSATPTGVFKIIGRSTKGWTTKTYTVKPLIHFMNYAYAFHSRLYKPGTTTVNDARIGFPVSHGCVRMYDEDVAWIYENIPTNTTVVVY
jgi:lipoprotein-anchoring transpeptidase ErfK/SrfK